MDAHHTPETAEALMRSRFAAFRDGDVDWLLASWHPSTRPAVASAPPSRAFFACSTSSGTITVRAQ